jgi:aspartyl aminopeptidase
VSILVKRNVRKLKRILIGDFKTIAFIPPPIKYDAKIAMDRLTAFNPIFGKVGSEKIKDYVAKIASVDPKDIVSMDLRFADSHPPELINDFISSGRLDDLTCAYTSLQSFLSAEPSSHVSIVAIFNNEEIGSNTFTGVQSDMISKVYILYVIEIKLIMIHSNQNHF